MKSFIETIDKHIRKEGIRFKQIVIKSECLPAYINYAILQKINGLLDAKEMFWPEEYTLEYDNDNRLFLRATSDNGRINIKIYGNNDYYFYHANSDKSIISDIDLYDYALILKYFENVRKKVYEKIDEYCKGKMELFKINRIRFEAMHDFYREKYYELGNKIRELCSLEDELDESIEKITSYIDYLNMRYQKSVEEAEEEIVYISYEDSEATSSIPRERTGISSHKPRKNEVISMDERRKVLEGYDHIYFGIASASNKDKKDYYCYLYKDYEGRNILVLEPYSGTQYTKVVYLNTRDLSIDEFKEVCTRTLELSFEETFEYQNIVRLGHTTMECFDQNISFILENKNETKCKPHVRTRVNNNRNKKEINA